MGISHNLWWWDDHWLLRLRKQKAIDECGGVEVVVVSPMGLKEGDKFLNTHV